MIIPTLVLCQVVSSTTLPPLSLIPLFLPSSPLSYHPTSFSERRSPAMSRTLTNIIALLWSGKRVIWENKNWQY